MQPGLRYMAMKKIGLSILIERDVIATCKSSHIVQLSALLYKMLLYKWCMDSLWYWGWFTSSLVPCEENAQKQKEYISSWSAKKLMQRQPMYSAIFHGQHSKQVDACLQDAEKRMNPKQILYLRAIEEGWIGRVPPSCLQPVCSSKAWRS